jgi:hypothetical protein
MIDKWIWYWSAIGKYQSMSIRKLLLVDFGWSTDFAIINIYWMQMSASDVPDGVLPDGTG